VSAVEENVEEEAAALEELALKPRLSHGNDCFFFVAVSGKDWRWWDTRDI
jgi:hypothetical protein